MPDPKTPTLNGGMPTVDLSDIPGGELAFEELFSSTESFPTVATTPEPRTTPSPEPQAPVATQEDFFLKTPTGTVYKTREDAATGVAHKDELIETYRRQITQLTGVDPASNRQAAPQAPANVRFSENGEAYVKALSEAYEQKDWNKYVRVQQQLMMEGLEPALPYVQSSIKSDAIGRVEAEIPDFRKFVGGADYQKALEAEPLLKDAIARAESDFGMAENLPGLYRMAYRTSQSLKLPEILAQSKQPAPAQPARETVASRQLPPPQPIGEVDLRNPEARKRWIEAMEAAGIKDVPF